MRNFSRIFLVVLIAMSVVFSMYYVADDVVKTNRAAARNTTATQRPVTEIAGDKKELYTSKEQDLYIYRQDDEIVLIHKKKEHRFTDWSEYMDLEEPTVLVKNIDKDKEPEILIRLVGNLDAEGKYLHYVYVLNQVKEDGEVEYYVTALTQNTADSHITYKVRSEVSQLPSCKKIGVFAMDMYYNSINYDRDTGRPTGYGGLFRTLQDKDGNYLTIDKWGKGAAEFSFEKGRVYVYIPVNVYYKGTDEVQHAGYMKCDISVNTKRYAYVVGHLSFVTNEEYGIYNFKTDAKKPWKAAINNSNTSAPSDNVIDYFTYENTFEYEDIATDDFSKNKTDLNKISKIVSTESYIEFTAKPGCKFDKDIVDKKVFSVRAMAYRKGESRNYDIAYTGELSLDKDGNQVLRINYDKTYDRTLTTSVEISFGV